MAFLIFIFAAVIFLFSPNTVFAAFNIDSITPATITSDSDVITLSVSATGLDNKPQHLQTAITKEGKTNYFGFTNNGSDWKKYESTPADYTSYFTFTPVDGKWSGSVQAKIDTADSGFTGSGTYTVKLLKYISSSSGASSNNTATINVNLASTAAETAHPSSEVNPPTISFTFPNNLTAGSEFSLPVQITNFASVPYYVKIRIGPDDNHLSHGQTASNGLWLSDTDSWSKFPQATGPNWQGTIKAQLSADQKEGTYRIAIRLKKVENDSFEQSDSKEVHFNAAPPAPPPPPKISSSPPPPAPVPPPEKQTHDEASVDGNILGISTESSAPEDPVPQPQTPVKPLIKSSVSHEVISTTDVLVCLGLFILGFGAVWFFRSKNI